MIGAARNKRTFWAAEFEKTEPVRDEYGNEYATRVIYTKPVKYRGNVSAGNASVGHQLFGMVADYTKIINPMPLDCPIREATILWIDKKPVFEKDGTTKTAHDYVVRHVGISINHKAYAIEQVNVADKTGEAP